MNAFVTFWWWRNRVEGSFFDQIIINSLGHARLIKISSTAPLHLRVANEERKKLSNESGALRPRLEVTATHPRAFSNLDRQHRLRASLSHDVEAPSFLGSEVVGLIFLRTRGSSSFLTPHDRHFFSLPRWGSKRTFRRISRSASNWWRVNKAFAIGIWKMQNLRVSAAWFTVARIGQRDGRLSWHFTSEASLFLVIDLRPRSGSPRTRDN